MTSNDIFTKIISILDKNKVGYKVFTHKPVFSYEQAAEAQKETGFFGTELKCLVLKSKDNFLVYITTQGKKVNFDMLSRIVGVKKLRLATPEELKHNFDAEPGCAYPFGFAEDIHIFIDPNIYDQDWLLFTPFLPTKTIQAKGSDLKKVFNNLKNKISEISSNI